MNPDVVNTQLGQALTWLDQLEGAISLNHEAMAGSPPTAESLFTYMGKIADEAMPLCDAIRTALHTARAAAGGE